MFVPPSATHHWLVMFKRSAWVSAFLAAIALPSCGDSGSSPVAIAPKAARPNPTVANATVLHAQTDGSFVLPDPIPATQIAASVQLLVASDDPLPNTIDIDSASYVRIPASATIAAEGFEAYIPTIDSFLTPISETQTVTLPGVSSARIMPIVSDGDPLGLSARTSGDSSAVSLLYRNNPTKVDAGDFLLTYALSFLPEDQDSRTPQKVADLANTLIGSELFSPNDFSPIPDAVNTDWASGGQPITPNIFDVAVVAAAAVFQDQGGAYNASNIVAAVNTLLEIEDFTVARLRGIPGLDPLPGSSQTPTPIPRDTLTFARSPLLASFNVNDNTTLNPSTGETVYFDEYILDNSDLTSGQNVRINMNENSGSQVDPVLSAIAESTGETIASNDDANGFNAEISFVIQSGETYIIRAENYNATNASEGGNGSYTILASVSTMPTPTPTPTQTPPPFIPDIQSSQGTIAFGSLVEITVQFANEISAPSSGASNAIGGTIEMDGDGFFAGSGASSRLGYNFLGVDSIIDISSEASNPGRVDILEPFFGLKVGDVPITFSPTSYTITLPPNTLIDPDFDGNIFYAVSVSRRSDNAVTDLFPNDPDFVGVMPLLQTDDVGDASVSR